MNMKPIINQNGLENIKYLRNVPYDTDTLFNTVRPSKVISASVVYNNRIWAGKRHAFLINQIIEDLKVGENDEGRAIDKDGNVIYVSSDMQGFLCDTGLHVSRGGAKGLCCGNGQIARDFQGVLLSEYLW